MLPNGVIVYWDFRNTVTIVAPDVFSGHVCGICGNYDNNPHVGDYVYGPSAHNGECPALAGAGYVPGDTPVRMN